MGLPNIQPYTPPAAATFPSPLAWSPSPRRCALLIHDMQQYFVGVFPSEAPPMTTVIPNIVRLRARCSALGVPVIFSAQPGGQSPQERGLLRDVWGDGPAPGPSTTIVDALRPSAGDHVLTKRRYSAFVGTPLASLLTDLHRDQLIICGIYAHIGCLATACDAFMRDIQPFLVADALGDFTAADHATALGYAAKRCAMVTSTTALLSILAPAEAPSR